jgi:hypothetical protein
MSKVSNTINITDNETQFAPPPDDSLPYLADWCNHFGLKKWLIPTDTDSNPLRIGAKIEEKINPLPETAETFRLTDFNLTNEPIWIAKELLYARKVTVQSSTNRRIRYKNPHYLHYDDRINPIKNTEDRLSFYNKYISYGTVSPHWIATHFGITTSRLRQFTSEYADNHSPQQHQRINQIKIGRTAKTISQWGYKNIDIATALGIPRPTLQDYMRKVDSDWLPPAPPTDKKWFSLFSVDNAASSTDTPPK